jgi:hypothetical protein
MSVTENLKTSTSPPETFSDNLDRPIWGAENIGREANLFKEDGSVDLRKTYFKLEKGYLDADKNGREWVTTPRRLRNLDHPVEPDSGE